MNNSFDLMNKMIPESGSLPEPGRVKAVEVEEDDWSPVERNMVLYMKMSGAKDIEIARVLRISKKDLQREFRVELMDAGMKLNADVVQALYQNVMKGNVTAQIFWCKAKMNWVEKAEVVSEGSKLIPSITVQVATVGSESTPKLVGVKSG